MHPYFFLVIGWTDCLLFALEGIYPSISPGFPSIVDMHIWYGHILYAKNIILNISRYALHFVFQSRICPVVGVQEHMCKSHHHSVGFSIALRSLGTEFSGNSKWGLCFSCKVWAFAIFPEDALKLFFRFSLRTKWNGKELMEKVQKQWGNKCSCQDTNLCLA